MAQKQQEDKKMIMNKKNDHKHKKMNMNKTSGNFLFGCLFMNKKNDDDRQKE